MKKIFVIAATLLSLSLSQTVLAQRSPAGKPAVVQVFTASELGKWDVVDMAAPSIPADKAAEVKAQLESMHMTWEFTKDGKAIMSAMGQAQEFSYARTGNLMEVTDTKTQQKDKMEITDLTDDQMVFKSEEDGETMTMTLKRVKS